MARNQVLVGAALQAARGHAQAAYELPARLDPTEVRGPSTISRALEALLHSGVIGSRA